MCVNDKHLNRLLQCDVISYPVGGLGRVMHSRNKSRVCGSTVELWPCLRLGEDSTDFELDIHVCLGAGRRVLQVGILKGPGVLATSSTIFRWQILNTNR